ncbi:hypothetical protein N1851_008277 [Merluccius polli]|uniref:Uncharacterized protein n=1 Tax=Merluccius polli TaxID=89951 RepID=A0AA47N1E4_MERPO|nr:hypothetical protein N1851_008277 [Merluccius polli]
MLQSHVNHDSPTTSRALRNSGRTSSTPGALPPRSFLTTSATSAPEIGEPTTRVPRPCFLTGRRVGGIEEVFEVFLPLIHNENLFEAIWKSFSMASPNSSHVRVFASVTATAALRLACRYLPAASGVPQAKKGPIGLLLQFDGIPSPPVSTSGVGNYRHGRHRPPCGRSSGRPP